MPAPNDLTPEEEAEFANHGVPSAGPGREPLADQNADGQQQQQGDGQQQQQGDGQQQQQGDGQQQNRQRDAQGRFVQQQDQGQQQRQEQQQSQGQQDGQQQDGQQGEPKMVPLNALHEQRARTAQLAQRAQLAETRLNAILSRQQQSGEAPEQMPNIGEDPAGYILALEQRLQRFEQERGESAENQRLDSAISMDEDTFTQMRPDYPQASDYFVQSRAKELLAFHPPQEAQRIMLGEARQIARMAWERGQSVGETIYGLAQARGYNPGMPQREPYQQQGQGQQGQGQQGQGQQRGPRATDVVDSINRGQQASRSLSGGGGGASAENLNAAALLDMDDDEFSRWLGEGSESTRRFANIG